MPARSNSAISGQSSVIRSRVETVAVVVLGLCVAASEAVAQQFPVQFDARRAFGYLEEICDIGPRVSGTQGMLQQQQRLIQHFRQFDCELRAQKFDTPHPQTGQPVRMTNLVVTWNPSARDRVLLCCHYDTRPFPDRDRLRPKGTFIGANDGASGVALFMEMAHHMRTIQPKYGVDFVFFDGEELIYKDGDKYFLGSEYFAKWYREDPPENFRYVCGVLADMVADKQLAIYVEKNSLSMAPAVTRSIWATAKRMGVKEFIGQSKYEVRDDHIALNQIAGIPTCDIIDFDYPYWHTTRDTARACSGGSLSKVGRVLLQWLTEVPIDPPGP